MRDSKKKPRISHTQEILSHPLHGLAFASAAFSSRGETIVKIVLACFIKAGQNTFLALFSCRLNFSHSSHLILLLQEMKRKRVPGMVHANKEIMMGAEMKCSRADSNAQS